MNSMRYSPEPVEAYFLQGMDQKCEAGSISKLARAAAVWNLFWLSVPKIDLVPSSGTKWVNTYMPINGVAASITADVMLDEALYRKLGMHPLRFANWFKDQDHSVFDVYGLLGEQEWVDTVIVRAHQSSARMASSGVGLKNFGNVIQVAFGQRAA